MFYCGNIDTPGISDLDFFAITNENNIDFKKVFLLIKILMKLKNILLAYTILFLFQKVLE